MRIITFSFLLILFACFIDRNLFFRCVRTEKFPTNWYQSQVRERFEKVSIIEVDMSTSKGYAGRFEIEKFDGKINFGLWQVQVKDILIQHGLHKALKGRSIPVASESSKDKEPEKDKSKKSVMSDDEWEELDMRAASLIRLCLAKNVLANIQGTTSAKELWERLEELYQAKSVCNRFYLKEQFHLLKMSEGTKVSDHLAELNGITSELESIGVEINDEDKALKLIWSLPDSYKYMKPILMHEN